MVFNITASDYFLILGRITVFYGKFILRNVAALISSFLARLLQACFVFIARVLSAPRTTRSTNFIDKSSNVGPIFIEFAMIGDICEVVVPHYS